MSVLAAKLFAMARCMKLRYRDRIAALLALAKVQHQDKAARAKLEQRAYRCPSCGGWHLTSRNYRDRTSEGVA